MQDWDRARPGDGRAMIAHLKGRLEATGIDHAVIDVGGVGYLVGASARTLSALGPVGEAATLFTEMLVSEDSIRLVGFARADERDWFRHLTGVQGVAARVPGPDVTAAELRDRSWWEGPEIYVVVDDYDMVAVASGNPLLPLVDMLSQARDIGLHLIVVRRSGGASRSLFDPVISRLKDLSVDGLMMSAPKDEGVLLGSTKSAPRPPGRGVLVTRAGDRLMQVAWSPPLD